MYVWYDHVMSPIKACLLMDFCLNNARLSRAESGSIHLFCRVCRTLSLADRATMVPVLGAVLDFDASPENFQRYDQMSAKELFQR